MTISLSALDYDIAIIGGGIHGVGVAQAAAARGYRTVLLEQKHLAYGTSRWSSKLIHGGLRYLENFDFALVKESLQERELLLKLAPDLVKRQDFYIPIFKETTRRPWFVGAGLLAYTVLAGGKKGTRFRRVPKSEWDSLDGLKRDNLDSVLQYTDAQTDDAKLTQAVMNSAIELGADLLCPATFFGARRIEGCEDSGLELSYEVDGISNTLSTKTIVNAAGPWTAELLSKMLEGLADFPVDLVQGTHIELPAQVQKGCYYLEVPEDKRAVFVMPWKDKTLFGTTEFTYTGDPHDVHSREESVEYLLRTYRHYFPNNDDTVIDQWAGLRVLPKATGAAFKRSRETQLPVDNKQNPSVLSIFGGKLTGYRATAEKVVDKLAVSLPKVKHKAKTSELPLSAEGLEEITRSN